MLLTRNVVRYTRTIFFTSIVAYSFLFSFVYGESVIIIYKDKQEEGYAALKRVMPKTVQLDAVTFESDSFLQEQEFFYLTGFITPISLTQDQIVKGIFYLFCKEKFKSILMRFKSTGGHLSLHVSLNSFWIVSKVTITGPLVGKDGYRQCYGTQPGEVFDTKKHAHCVKNVSNTLNQEGFFNNSVQDHLYYDEQTKTVSVCLELSKGDQFAIGDVDAAVVINTKNEKKAEAALLKEELKKIFSSRLADKMYSREAINKAAKEGKQYLQQKGFLDISLELKETVCRSEKKIDLLFTSEVYQKKEFIFLGNQFFSCEQLVETILLFGHSASLLPASILAEEIMHMYQKKGFWQIKIDTKEEDGRYFFLVHEGTRAYIKDVRLMGISHFDAQELKKEYFSGFLKGSYFDEDILQDALNKLTTRYVSDGFLDARLIKKEIIPLNEEKYCIVLAIDEGDASYLTKVLVDGCSDECLDFSFLMPYLNGPPPLFTSTFIKEQEKMLDAYLRKYGYVHVELDSQVIRNKADVTIRWHIKADKQEHRFGKTVIVTSQQFSPEYVLQELTFKEGDSWDSRHLSLSLVNIKELELFDYINLHPSAYQPSAYEKPIVLKLHKDDPYEFRMRTGLGIEYAGKPHTYKGITYKAGATAIVKNPFNRADRLRIEGDFTRFERSISLKYWRPWFLYKPIRSLFQVYNTKFYYPGVVDGRRNLYEVLQQGFLINLTRKWMHIQGATVVGLEWMETRMSNECIDGIFSKQIARAINFAPRLLDKKIPYFMFEPTVFIDYLDNKLYPTSGSLTVFSLKAMVPIERLYLDAYFIKLLVEHSVFVPFQSLVLATRLRFGHIFHQIFSSVMPSERFYLGGVNSIRSYETDRCPPLGIVTDECGKTFLVPQGGKTMFNLNLETRFPLYQMIAGAVFQDFGFLTGGSVRNVVKEDLLAGTGFGVRLITPIGPLRFDIAWKWHVPEKRLSSYAWFLTLGTIF